MLLAMRYGSGTHQPQLRLPLAKAGVHPTGVPLALRICYGKHKTKKKLKFMLHFKHVIDTTNFTGLACA